MASIASRILASSVIRKFESTIVILDILLILVGYPLDKQLIIYGNGLKYIHNSLGRFPISIGVRHFLETLLKFWVKSFPDGDLDFLGVITDVYHIHSLQTAMLSVAYIYRR